MMREEEEDYGGVDDHEISVRVVPDTESHYHTGSTIKPRNKNGSSSSSSSSTTSSLCSDCPSSASSSLPFYNSSKKSSRQSSSSSTSSSSSSSRRSNEHLTALAMSYLWPWKPVGVESIDNDNGKRGRKCFFGRRAGKKCLWVALVMVVLFAAFMEINYGNYLRYQVLNVRGRQALDSLMGDAEHHRLEKEMLAQMEYKLARYQDQFHDQICEEYQKQKLATGPKGPDGKPLKFAWITSVKNELYVQPTLVFGHTIQKYSCEKEMLVIVGESVGEESRQALRNVGFQVKQYKAFDCRSQSKGYGFGYFADIPGSQMKMYCWNNTQYDRLLYADGDLLLLSSIDELFTFADLKEGEIAAAYCETPGKVDPCFNSGLVLLRPSAKTFDSLLQTWKDLQTTVGCVNDQSYLYHYFAQPGRKFHLFPYAYNVRRQSYHPMRVYHAAGYKPKKPWLVPLPREEAQNVPILQFPEDMYKVWWFYFYEALDQHNLHKWWEDWSKVSHKRE